MNRAGAAHGSSKAADGWAKKVAGSTSCSPKPPFRRPRAPRAGRGTARAHRATRRGLEFWQTAGAYEAELPQEPPELRQLAGLELAKRVPHASHAEWKPPRNRPNPVDVVVAGNAGRVAELVPLRM